MYHVDMAVLTRQSFFGLLDAHHGLVRRPLTNHRIVASLRHFL
jgi:hypothetical protein